MKVSIRVFTSLREIIKTKEETLEFSDNEKVTIDKVLAALTQKHGEDFADYVYDAKTHCARGFLQFLVNGTSASTLDELQTELSDGDVLAILPPVGGG